MTLDNKNNISFISALCFFFLFLSFIMAFGVIK